MTLAITVPFFYNGDNEWINAKTTEYRTRILHPAPIFPSTGNTKTGSSARSLKIKKTFWSFIMRSMKQIHLPTPQYVVFYNGTSDEPDRSILRLSDAYMQKDIRPALECTAVMLNINYGHNTALMEKCRNLRDYAVLISEIRQKLSQGMPLEPAVADAVDECIRKGILHDILVKNKVEVISMILTSFDQEEYEKTIRDESYEEGLERGLEQGLERGRHDGIRQVILSMLKKGLSTDEIKDMTDVSDEVIEQVRAML